MWYVRQLIMKVILPEPIFGLRVITSVKPIREDSYAWRAHSRGGGWYKFSMYEHGITPISGPHFTPLAPVSSPPITRALPSSKGRRCPSIECMPHISNHRTSIPDLFISLVVHWILTKISLLLASSPHPGTTRTPRMFQRMEVAVSGTLQVTMV